MRFSTLTMCFLLLAGCAGLKTYNRSNNFIDIEAASSSVWLGCSQIDLKSPISLMTFYLLEAETVHEFMERRVSSVKECLRVRATYNKLIDDVPSVRLVGIAPDSLHGKGLVTDRAPMKFHAAKNGVHWTFIRLQTLRGCESYFDGDCAPENYWGGIIPPTGAKVKK